MRRAADALVVRVVPPPNLHARAYVKPHQAHRFLGRSPARRCGEGARKPSQADGLTPIERQRQAFGRHPPGRYAVYSLCSKYC